MAYSLLLEQIHFQTQSHIFRHIDSISQNYRQNSRSFELIFTDRQELALAKLTIGPKEGSRVAKSGPKKSITPSINVLEWKIDRVHRTMQDSGVQHVDAGSRLSLSALTSFTLDITLLTAQGLVHVCNVLQRSALESLHIQCVPFMPFQEASIVQVLQAIHWPTIKSLVLIGTNIDDSLQLWTRHCGFHDLVGAWADSFASGPCLASLSIIGHK